MRIYPTVLLGGALTSSSTSYLQHNVWRAFAGKQRVISNVFYARQLTTRPNGTTQGPDSLDPGPTKRPRHRRIIRTLDPTKLTPHDHIDFSTLSYPCVNFVTQSTAHRVVSNPRSIEILAWGWPNKRFPTNTTGFLYYHIPSYTPPLAGEVRFRITPSSDPSSFAMGSDLLMRHGIPWRIPLLYVAGRDIFKDLHALLIRDGFITPQILDAATSAEMTLTTTGHIHKVGSTVTALVSSFRRGFNLRLGRSRNGAWIIIGKDAVARRIVHHFGTFTVSVGGTEGIVQYYPFQGTRHRLTLLPPDS